jgi:hypothetical protein
MFGDYQRRYCHLVLKVMFILWAGCVYASSEDMDFLQDKIQKDVWIQSKHDKRRDIQTWYKQETGKHTRTFKIEATIKVPMEQTAMALVGGDSWQRWFWECLESKLLKKVSSRESLFYLKVNVPRPFPDRDTVLRAVIEPYSKKTGKLVINFNAVPDYIAKTPDVVRAKAFTFKVELTPLTDTSVKLDLEGYVNPGQDLPAWAVNFMMRNAPYSSVLGIERYLKTHGLDDTSSFDFKE